VAGAGPAGAAAALELARRGLRCVVLEKLPLPRYKTCGGGVVRRALRLLPPDVAPALETHCFAAEMHLHDAGLCFEVRRSEAIVSTGMRAELDMSLLDAARAVGVEVRAPCAVLDLVRGARWVEVVTPDGPLRARFVVAADGARSRVADLTGWRDDPPVLAPALECEVRVASDMQRRFEGVARFDFGIVPHGYAWVFPKREHLSVGVLSTRRGAGHLREDFTRYVAHLGLGEPLAIEMHGALVPVRPRRGALARERVLLVGDAAGLADPVTCEGITYALRSGQLAAGAIVEGGDDAERVSALYQERVHREILRELRLARILAAALYGRPGLRTALFHRFGQALCEAVTEVILGSATYRELLSRPQNYLQVLAPMAGHRKR
jgi:geranylgeranyl reductase family protein